jgi:hypothetical protein
MTRRFFENIKDVDIKYMTPGEIKILYKYQVFEGTQKIVKKGI